MLILQALLTNGLLDICVAGYENHEDKSGSDWSMQSENCHKTNCFKILFFPRAHINTHWLQRPAVTLKLPLRWPSSMVSQPGERQPWDPTPLFPRKPFPRRVISDFSLTRLRGDLPRSSDIFTLHLHLSGSLADRWCTTGDFTTKFHRSSRFSASAV